MDTRPIFIVIVIGLLAATVVFADAYKWVDSDGVVHYSDRPAPGAERVVLSTDGRSSARPTAQRAVPGASEGNEPPVESKPFRYESITFSSPGAEETLWNIAGVLNVSLALTPALQSNHQVRVYLDGGAAQTVTGTSFQLDEVYRGVHNIQAEIIDETGKLMIRTSPNRFYVQQNIIKRGGQ